MAKALKSGLAGGIVIFIWSMISWMVLPWHMNTLHHFKDDKAVTQVIEANAPATGIYTMPTMDKNGEVIDKELIHAPMVFAAVKLSGVNSTMIVPMIISLITQIIAATLVAWLLLQATGLSYLRRVGFVTMFAIAVSIISNIPYWNWFGFDMQYTMVMMADTIVAWFLAGLVMAFFCKK